MRWLAGQVNPNISQLERSFTRQVGVGPKLLARQTRLCALAAGAMELAGPAWALLAANYGYADQAYLAPEFRELTGLTPSRLARAGCGQTGQETSTASQAREKRRAAAEPRPPARPGHSSPAPVGSRRWAAGAASSWVILAQAF